PALWPPAPWPTWQTLPLAMHALPQGTPLVQFGAALAVDASARAARTMIRLRMVSPLASDLVGRRPSVFAAAVVIRAAVSSAGGGMWAIRWSRRIAGWKRSEEH